MVFLKTLAHTLLIPGTVLALVPYLILRGRNSMLFELEPWTVSALLWVLAGIVIGSWSTLDFMIRGSGTPNPLDPPKLLVDRGLYGYVRNPGYVSVAFILIGEALFFRSVALAIYSAVLLIVIHLLVVLWEEPVLGRRYGDSYAEYRKRVSRWIPRSRAAQQGDEADRP